jgi:hypothetical protein
MTAQAVEQRPMGSGLAREASNHVQLGLGGGLTACPSIRKQTGAMSPHKPILIRSLTMHCRRDGANKRLRD